MTELNILAERKPPAYTVRYVAGGFCMNKKYLRELFLSCLEAEYTHVENSGSYAVTRDGDVLYLFFEKSNGIEDWWNNLSYRAVERGRENDRWFCHEGFLRTFDGIIPHIQEMIARKSVRRIVTVGYSHGAALALLCHEYVWFTREDIRDSIEGYGFGCPRAVFGNVKNEAARWKNFYVIRNLDDIVTHLPPSVTGYKHKGRIYEIGKSGKYSGIDAHRAENYLFELEN